MNSSKILSKYLEVLYIFVWEVNSNFLNKTINMTSIKFTNQFSSIIDVRLYKISKAFKK